MNLYLDVCCYNRPFDDFSDDRIRLEAEAVAIIMERCEQGKYTLISSDVVFYGVSKIPNQDKQDAVLRLISVAGDNIKISTKIMILAQKYEELKVKPFDALHLASAEYGDIDLFLTTDDKLLKRAKELDLKIRVLNPIDFIHEELFHA